MSWIFLEAMDVWLFRDGRPFSAGEGHMARSMFPPSPMTVQGALRSLILGHSAVDWQEFARQNTPEAQLLSGKIGHPSGNGRRAKIGAFSLAGPFVARREGEEVVRFTPLPADVVRRTGTNEYLALRPIKNLPYETHWDNGSFYPLWPGTDEDVESPDSGGWLNESALHTYLNGKGFSPTPMTVLVQSEPRFGIQMDDETGRPTDQMLYQAEFQRPQADVGLLIELGEQVALPEPVGLLALGGEARAARYMVLESKQIKATAGLEQPTPLFKLVLLTPAWFSGGWQPANGNIGWSRLLGLPVKLISASLKRAQPIGGWDMAASWHKSMYHFVPAGSVYFFESVESTDKLAFNQLKPVTETPPDELPLGAQGFGQVAVGSWEWLNFS